MRRDSQGYSGIIGTTWGLAAAVCRVDEAGFPGILGDHRDNLGSGGRGMQGGGVAGGSVLRNLTTPTCRVGKKADVFCHALLWYVLFCHVVSCSVLSCHVVFCHVRRGREAGYPGASGASGTLGTTWGLAAAVCRVGLAGGSVLEI